MRHAKAGHHRPDQSRRQGSLAARGITVNAVAPGFVETEMTSRAVRNRAGTGSPGADSHGAVRQAGG